MDFAAIKPARQSLDFDIIQHQLSQTKVGDVLLLQASCHNPTGVDPAEEQWEWLAKFCDRRGLLPFVDCAYQGLGSGLDEDVAGLRIITEKVDQALIAYSCDKNFGLYRERVGALWVKARQQLIDSTRSNLFELTRSLWSMPPDHGAAVVRIILGDASLRQLWLDELTEMRFRIAEIRQNLANSDPKLAAIAGQSGLFSMLALRQEDVITLRKKCAIYMAPSGRINVAGLMGNDVGRFVSEVCPLLK